jgi:exopolysaccharide biosynthesis polyprenyl glycosylphosphotransferase
VAEARGILTSPALAAVPQLIEVKSRERAEHADGRTRAATSWARTALALDVAMLAAASAAAEFGARAAGVGPMPLMWLVVFPLAVLVGMYARSMYDWQIRLQSLDDVRSVLAITALAAMAVLSLRVIVGDTGQLSAQTLRLWGFAAFYVAAGRVALSWSQSRARRHGETAKPTLIVGAGRIGRLTARRLLEHPEFGLRPVGFLDKEPRTDPDAKLPVLGASWDLERVIAAHSVEHVVISFSTAPNEVLLGAIKRCEELGVDVSLVPRLFEQVTGRLSVEHIGGLPLLTTQRADPKGWQFAVKYILDRAVAAVLLALVLPLLLVIAVLVRLSVGSPLFFRQRRVGLDGREFEMLKFRSMRDGEHIAPVSELPTDTAPGGVEGDDRRTRVGALLRRTSLDELPQLLNVLRGEMSLVGPRPERPEFVRMFERDVYRYDERHRVKSGITGWSQVNGLRGKTSLSDRVEWDNYYIENWSLWLDVKILLRTLLAVPQAFSQSE